MSQARRTTSAIMEKWPEESREAAQLVIDKHGEPDEVNESMFIWRHRGPWKRIIAYRDFNKHYFPVPHIDAIESVINYRVPPHKFSALAEFDGSVVADRTSGEMSARCHDEEANMLALNLAHDIVQGKKSVQEAREYYAHEFLAYRKKEPTPYMERLRFEPGADTGDPDERMLKDEQLREAVAMGQAKGT